MKKNFMPVKSADRVFDILELLAQQKNGIHIRELGKQLNIADSSIHALVHTMLQRRFLKMDGNRRIWLGSKVYEFSNIVSADPLLKFSKPVMKEIKQRFNQNVHLAVLDGLDVVYIAYEESNQPIRYHMEVGKVQSAHVTGLGKMLLSSFSDDQIKKLYQNYVFEKLTPTTIDSVNKLVKELNQIRQRGYSIDDAESYKGCKCFAAPIYDRYDKMIASVSISIPFFTDEDAQREPELILTVKEAANRISLLLKENV
ncbi:IclR family transcriptional regulator [Alicyclobacillus fastidiosus]|uniref:IclR family transcriptional regulator n=1 Tax=Alicyclobacillus fastidiosus TaxID=392011 RepID=A0ABY6ZPM0_9BACL|nr:IclR family transcriptional regulator [Alicyclobacillus fastidiosus]WAH44392.1 IclR family transcriptional regulator [Alicyclobacillus fastidiosus]GMA60728.1 IclR family transcriptional regulator [Alicyclobacillus fastidiosus]